MRVFNSALLLGAKLPVAVAILVATAWHAPAAAQARTNTPPASVTADSARRHSNLLSDKVHRVIVQISQNDPAIMNLALNNAENLAGFYQSKGERVEIEFVAYGAGLNMVRSDTSPVKERLIAMSHSMRDVTFSGCGNTLANQSKAENKTISLLPEARLVPTGVARIVELEEQGWTYLRP
jgi:intracellular sulfur oxidation DsrE/DsrF family protein